MNAQGIVPIATSALGGLAVLGLIFFSTKKSTTRNSPQYLFSTRPSNLSDTSSEYASATGSVYGSAHGSESKGGKRKSKRKMIKFI